MGKFVFCNDEFKIIHNHGDFVLINLKGKEENHGHFLKKNTCFMLIRLMKKYTVPKSKFLQDAVLRISTDDLYKQKILNKQEKLKNKPHYINVNSGIKN